VWICHIHRRDSVVLSVLLVDIRCECIITGGTPSSTRGQFSGLPGRDAMTPVFLEELQRETNRASCRSLLRMDFDASSCYDRIIPRIASLAARSFGQHQALCFIHATFLRQARYILKTKLGYQMKNTPIVTCTQYMAPVKVAQTAPSFGLLYPAAVSMLMLLVLMALLSSVLTASTNS
jgi:hypothetical protein